MKRKVQRSRMSSLERQNSILKFLKFMSDYSDPIESKEVYKLDEFKGMGSQATSILTILLKEKILENKVISGDNKARSMQYISKIAPNLFMAKKCLTTHQTNNKISQDRFKGKNKQDVLAQEAPFEFLTFDKLVEKIGSLKSEFLKQNNQVSVNIDINLISNIKL